jgi:hypothetical protein
VLSVQSYEVEVARTYQKDYQFGRSHVHQYKRFGSGLKSKIILRAEVLATIFQTDGFWQEKM